MRRAVLLLVLSLLLISMQHRGYVHPIAHLGGHSPSQEAAFSSPQAGESCMECALLSGGFTAVLVAFAPLGFGESANGLVFHSYHSRAGEVPAWFQSRAPPVLL